MNHKYIKIHPSDKVAVALYRLEAGTKITGCGTEIILSEDIPQGHKFALSDMEKGESVIKYGSEVGIAVSLIRAGEWVHTHNMKTALDDTLSYTYNEGHTVLHAPFSAGVLRPIRHVKNDSPADLAEKRYFKGYRRADGKAGVRNEIWIIPTVGCVNSVAAAVSKKACGMIKGSIETVCAFSHPYGCSQMGKDQDYTRQILADLVNHPNAGGVLVLGLGCENSNIEELKKYIGPYDEKRVKFLNAQDVEDEIEAGLSLVRELIDNAGSARREPVPFSELVIGLKCGGSDGLSGITANPAVGVCSDLLIAQGGTAILTEVPEMFGAETVLMNRCENRELFEKTFSMINDFKHYFKSHGQVVYENPSPGNKEGGISTLEDKSMGCIQKSGNAPVRGVLAYGEPVKENGLNLLNAPGNDLVASTALAASGAHIVLFTTGRGTPFASPVPTIKISSNSDLFRKKKGWIDFDCGAVAEGESLLAAGERLFDYVTAVASGEKVRSERCGFRDMAIFKQGVTL